METNLKTHINVSPGFISVSSTAYLAPITTMPKTQRLSYLPDFEGSSALYRRLDTMKDELRLLTVWPNEDFSAPLECALRTTTILEDLSYGALSYYWGSANDLELVIVHGSDEGRPTPSFEVPVTVNLTSALRHLRMKATTSGEPLVMWTDALCINQRDTHERSAQVNVMAEIFQFSRKICVWLGVNDNSSTAGKGLKRLAELYDYLELIDYDQDSSVKWITKYLVEQDLNASELLGSIMELMDLPYWYRGWIFQEICCHNVPIIIALADQAYEFGKVRMLANVLHVLANFASVRDIHSQSMVGISDAIGVPFKTLSTMYEARMGSHWLSHPKLLTKADKLLDQVLNVKMWHTTDARDSFYVLRGFHPAFAGFSANYKSSVELLFTSAACRLLDCTRTWSHWYWYRPSQSPFLPSWVIDFTANAWHRQCAPTEFAGNFNASANSEFRVHMKAPGPLRTAAFIHDEIEQISRCPTNIKMDRAYQYEPWLDWYKMSRAFIPRDPVAIFRTASGGLGPGNRRFALQDVLLFWEHPLGKSLGVPKPPRLDPADQKAFDAWQHRVCYLRSNRRFFITKQGRMGLAPVAAAVGDRIAIFASGDMPFVVRRVSDEDGEAAKYILMGSCYLDGESFCF